MTLSGVPVAVNCVSRASFVAFAVSLSAVSHATSNEPNCLYAVTVGQDRARVIACEDSDSLEVAKDLRVHSAMRALGIPGDVVRFRGCPGMRFSAIETVVNGGARRFVVTYPTEVGSKYLAPVIHELAHVMQMRAANGLGRLRAGHSSIEIELGADFLVGYIFARVLTGIDRDEFQHNLSLVGSYVERPEVAHGKPEHRVSAFRIGAVGRYPYTEFDAHRASEYFIQNDVAAILLR